MNAASDEHHFICRTVWSGAAVHRVKKIAFDERRHVGSHAVMSLRTTRMNAEAGDHFVEDQRDAVALCDVAQRAQKLRGLQRGAAGHIAPIALASNRVRSRRLNTLAAERSDTSCSLFRPP